MEKIWLRTKELVGRIAGKITKKTLIISGAVVLVGIAVILNFVLLSHDNKKENGGIDPALNLTEQGENKDSTYTNADYFASMTLSRQQSRDEAIEVLKAVAESETAEPKLKSEAAESMKEIAAHIEKEANIQSLLQAKGFARSLAIVDSGRATVIVESDGLLPNQFAQISEIVYEATGILPANLKIIEKSTKS